MTLTVSRRDGESILLSGGIRITYHAAGGRFRNPRIEIQAPEDVRILREEIARPDDRETMGHAPEEE